MLQKHKITFSSNPNKLYSFLGDELKRLIEQRDLVHAELYPLLPRGNLLSGYNLKEPKENHTIPKVLVNLLYLYANFPEVRVAPSSECLHSRV